MHRLLHTVDLLCYRIHYIQIFLFYVNFSDTGSVAMINKELGLVKGKSAAYKTNNGGIKYSLF